MSMTPQRLRQAIMEMDDAQLEDIISAMGRARDTAMRHTVKARIPECGDFGAIAQDLDATLSALEEAAPVSEPDPLALTRAEVLGMQGISVQDVPMSYVDPSDLRGMPEGL